LTLSSVTFNHNNIRINTLLLSFIFYNQSQENYTLLKLSSILSANKTSD